MAQIGTVFGMIVVAVVLGEQQRRSRMIRWQEMRVVNRLMAADHRAIRDAGRILMANHPNMAGRLNVKDKAIPKSIRDLRPWKVELYRPLCHNPS